MIGDCTELESDKLYKIKNRSGEWHYAHDKGGVRKIYCFWKPHYRKPNEKVWIELSANQVHQQVSLIRGAVK